MTSRKPRMATEDDQTRRFAAMENGPDDAVVNIHDNRYQNHIRIDFGGATAVRLTPTSARRLAERLLEIVAGR